MRIGVDPARARQFALYLRIPGWTGNQVMPGDLYSFPRSGVRAAELKVNGRVAILQAVNGYVRIEH